MAKYFKYKSQDAIEQDARRLGLDLRFSATLAPLAQPIAIGPRTVGNRMAIHPMEGCDGTPDGKPGDLTLRRYERFGGGGAKIIWGEATAVVPEGRANPRQLLINDYTASSLEELLRRCRAAHHREFGRDNDLLVGLQLTHSGRYSYPAPRIAVHDPVLDPLTIADRSSGRPIGPGDPLLGDDELRRLEDAYAAAARLAARIGFDFVDVKQCHRYLLSELLAAKTRPGAYGGPLENRTRMVRNILGKIRAVAPGLILATRINAFDGIPYRRNSETGIGEPCAHDVPLRVAFGTDEDHPDREDLREPLRLAGWLREWGVALVNVSMGNPYANPHVGRPFEYPPPDGYETPEHPLAGVARQVRIATVLHRANPGLVLVGTGYSWLQQFAFAAAAASVADDRIAIVGLGRAALPYPESIRAALAGAPLDRKTICRTFSLCTALMRSKHNALGQFATGCPPFDRQVYGPIWDEARRGGGGTGRRLG